MRHFLSLFDLTDDELREILDRSRKLKRQHTGDGHPPLLERRVLAVLFEKPSLRTRVSFEAAMTHLGGSSLYLGPDVGWGTRESIADFARALSCYVDLIVCRAKKHSRLEMLARHAGCPVINGLTDACHPCQVLADLLTLQELRDDHGSHRVVYIGDANNVARSLAIGCGKLQIPLTIVAPDPYQLTSDFIERLEREVPRAQLRLSNRPGEAVRDASVIYTDVWASMGQESEQETRARVFADFQVNADLMAAAPDDCRFMHCLPARRGQEVTDDVLDGSASVVFQQAENRLHAQKGLLAWLAEDLPRMTCP